MIETIRHKQVPENEEKLMDFDEFEQIRENEYAFVCVCVLLNKSLYVHLHL